MKVAFVTGGSGGIGAAVCRRLAADGVTVAVGYKAHREKAEKIAAEVGGMAVFCDVTSRDSVEKAVDNVLEKFCQLDILVCAAGVAHMGLVQEMTVEDYRRVMETDLDGVFFAVQAGLKPMIRQKSGRIVTVSSMWGTVGASCECAYSAAKAGVVGLTRAVAKEVAPSGVTVNCVSPGVIDTPMVQALGAQGLQDLADQTPLGRLGTPEDVAEAVAYLCGDGAGFVTGQVLGVDGGFLL